MREQYDFTRGEHGKFYRTGAKLRLPVHLEATVESCLTKIAEKRGISLDDLVNELLRKEVARIETID